MSRVGNTSAGNRATTLIFFALILAVAGGLSLLASSQPDGFERVLEDHASDETVAAHQAAHENRAPMPDYTVPVAGLGHLSTTAAGILGALCTLAALYGLTLLLKGRQRG